MVRIFPLFLWVLLLVSSAVQGQANRGVITGTVTDSDGAPLAGASVVVDSLKAGVATGNDGQYNLR
jgi:hypothetical protein